MSETSTTARRGELLAELFLQDFDPLFLARVEIQRVPFDYIMGFEARNGSLRTFAVEIRASTAARGFNFPLIGSKNYLKYYAHSNIPVLLLVVNPKSNNIYYAWGSSVPDTGISYLGRAGRIAVPVTPANDEGRAALKSVFID